MNPRTDAHALHDLLSEVRGSGARAIQHGWVHALGTEYGTAEFARRHAEVVSLLASTLKQIGSLPGERTRTRFQPYVPAWWSAVVVPDVQWNTANDPASILSAEHLHLLDSAADLIEAHMRKTAISPGSFDLGPVLEQCKEWIDVLQADLDVTQPLKLSLLQDLEHIVWLVENSDKFGVARVAAAGQTAVGGLAIAGARLPKNRVEEWKERLRRLAGTLLVLSVAFEAGTEALESGQEFVAEVASIVGPDSEGVGGTDPEIVDGDIVEDGQQAE